MIDRLSPYRDALYHGDEKGARAALDAVAGKAEFKHCHPFGTKSGSAAFFENCLAPLFKAMPDLERREWIAISGKDDDGSEWLGFGGHYFGTFIAPFLDIPPTGHIAHMRFHEFYRVEDDQIVEFQAIWDIPELMLQANAWPMAPSLGREWHVPGPATQDGFVPGPYDEAKGKRTCQHIIAKLSFGQDKAARDLCTRRICSKHPFFTVQKS